MVDERRISICIPTFQRVDMTLDSFKEVYDDERVSEIIIVDDASDISVFEELKSICDVLPKVKLYRNLTNQDCYRNKMVAIGYATNDWCILLDSDNKIGKDYIDRLFDYSYWDNDTIYAPTFAKPTFDYRAYGLTTIHRTNVADFIDKPLFETALNTCNYFVNKNEYLKVWDGSIDPVTSDSIYFTYCWLNTGNRIYFVEGLEYEHKVWSGSHYDNNVNRTPAGFHESILNNLRNMK